MAKRSKRLRYPGFPFISTLPTHPIWLKAFVASFNVPKTRKPRLTDDSAQTDVRDHVEIEDPDQACSLHRSDCIDTGPTRPNTDCITPCVWHSSHWSISHCFDSTGMFPMIRSRRGPLTTRPSKRFLTHMSNIWSYVINWPIWVISGSK